MWILAQQTATVEPGAVTEWLRGVLSEAGMGEPVVNGVAGFLLTLGIIAVGGLLHLLFSRAMLRLLEWVVHRTATTWDNVFLDTKALKWLTQWVPALVVYLLARFVLAPDYPAAGGALASAAQVYAVITGALAISALLSGLQKLGERQELHEDLPLTTLVQLAKLILGLAAFLLIIAALTGQDLLKIIAGMGVMASILMLVFKDSILGLVAGIQLSANKMIRPGDWIEMPKYHADGDVLAVGLTTVKVRNWDKTITTIPTYALVTDAFKNWRGMEESEGRRIKRALYLDTNTIQRCSEEMLRSFHEIDLLHDYLKSKETELAEWNQDRNGGDEASINCRRLTNVGTYRAYCEAYLRHHPKIHQDLTLLVRQLAPGPQGLPIEIYCFSNDKRWGPYEGIQSDIFDHLIAIAPEFGLCVYQNPSGMDVRALISQLTPRKRAAPGRRKSSSESAKSK